MSQEGIDKEGLNHVVHRRSKTKVTEGPTGRVKDDSWLPPSRSPACRQQQRMVGCFLKEVIKLMMSNLFYSFDNKMYHQNEGAAIGNLASEKLGKFGMKIFDRKFIAILKKAKVELSLYTRYVDDIMSALAAIACGVRWEMARWCSSQRK